MKYQVTDNLLSNIKFSPSDNADERYTEGQSIADSINLLVIHGISLPPGKFGGKGVEQLFTNQLDPDEHPYYKEIAHLKVSSHLYIKRTGEVIQFVPFNKRAWHAGVSHYKGRDKCNDFSIGIELEGTDDIPYTEAQYKVLQEVVAALLKAYPNLTKDNIVGHDTIAPGRKTDPGKVFDWALFKDSL